MQAKHMKRLTSALGAVAATALLVPAAYAAPAQMSVCVSRSSSSPW